MEYVKRLLLTLLPTTINLCLVAIISYYSVHFGLSLYSNPFAQQAISQPTNLNAPNIIVNSQSLSQLDVQPIINAHLFGQTVVQKTQNTSTNKPIANQNIPETRLKINLQGIYYSDNPTNSFVIIDDKKLSLNTAIQAGVLLYQIEPKKIILSRNNRFESLALREPLTPSAPNAANNTPNGDTPEVLLARYKKQLKSNPRALSQLARIQPAYDDGKFIGYRLSAGKDKTLLSQFNLQVGDILTTVNNVELDSPLKGLSLMQQLSEAEQLDLTVLRNGRPYSLSFNIKN